MEDEARHYSRPVIPLLVSLMAGIASGVWLPGGNLCAQIVIPVASGLLLLGLLINLLFGLRFGIKQGKASAVIPLLLFISMGYLLVQPWVSPRFPTDHVVHYAGIRKWRIIGEIAQNPIIYKNRLRFVLRAESLEADGASFPVMGNLRVTVRGESPGLSAGDFVSIEGRIKSIRNFNNPGGFDYQRYMAFKKIWATTYVQANRVVVMDCGPGKKHVRMLDRMFNQTINQTLPTIRRTLSEFIEKNARKESGEVLKALVIGDKSGISRELREDFNRSGTGHLLAISGLHIGIVATVAFVWFRRVLSYIKPLLWRAWTRKGAAVLSIFPVLAYGMIAGFSPSTQRAVIMVVVFLMTFLLEREQDPINTLSVAAILILVIHPPSLFSISFQLSFVAVFSILYGMSKTRPPSKIKWTEIERTETKAGRFQTTGKLVSFFWVSFFAVFGTLPLVMLYFNQISLVGLAANFILVPIIGFVVVPLGLFSAFLYPVSTICASWSMRAGAAVLEGALEIVRLFASIPFGALKTVTPTGFEICCYYLMGWAVLNLIEKRPPNTGDRGAERGSRQVSQSRSTGGSWTRKRTAMTVALIVLAAGWADALYWANRRLWNDDLRVTIIDVGQGSAALLELPKGRRMLIDGGGFSDNSLFDVGERIVAPLLWRKKIRTVDTLILSHPNSDHMNGLIYIAAHFHVKEIWTNNDTADTMGYRAFERLIKKTGISVPIFKELPRRLAVNGAELHILYPPKDFAERKKKEKWRTINNNSLVVKVTFGPTSLLFPGDIKARAEKELVEAMGEDLRSTILIAPHHGSRFSSTESFLERVDPHVVIVSAGWKNIFNLPHPSVLKRYEKREYRVLRTDSHGAITISIDNKSFDIRTMLSPI
jgi:competence protein ComEC